MLASFTLPKRVLIILVVISVSLVVGYTLANPDSYGSILLLSGLVGVMALPVMIRHYHPLLVVSLSTPVVFNFLPGQLNLWMVMAICGVVITFLNRSLVKLPTSLHVPAISWALVFFIIVTMVTSQLTGGLGFRVTGSAVMGGKRYYYAFAAVFIYFVLASKAIPKDKALLYMCLWLVPAAASFIANIAYLLGPSFYWVFSFLSADSIGFQVAAEQNVAGGIVRWSGIMAFGVNSIFLLLVFCGIEGVLDIKKPWRLMLFLLALGLSLTGGFRGTLVFLTLILSILFFIGGLHRKAVFPMLILTLTVGAIFIVPNATKLPLAMQRTLTVVPGLEVLPEAKWDAEDSKDWRLNMWKLLWPQVPQYMIIGKGFGIDPTEQYLMQESAKRGFASGYEISLVNGDFHNGPLSVLIPLGIFGAFTFLWFSGASLWMLYRNFKYGDPDIKNINAFLFAFFLSKFVFFLTIFGSLTGDLIVFASVAGLGTSLNSGVASKPTLPAYNPAPTSLV
ncbi:MAG: O-antigen ligase family protein [Verrucomicrobiota bacterium]